MSSIRQSLGGSNPLVLPASRRINRVLLWAIRIAIVTFAAVELWYGEPIETIEPGVIASGAVAVFGVYVLLVWAVSLKPHHKNLREKGLAVVRGQPGTNRRGTWLLPGDRSIGAGRLWILRVVIAAVCVQGIAETGLVVGGVLASLLVYWALLRVLSTTIQSVDVQPTGSDAIRT